MKHIFSGIQNINIKGDCNVSIDKNGYLKAGNCKITTNSNSLEITNKNSNSVLNQTMNISSGNIFTYLFGNQQTVIKIDNTTVTCDINQSNVNVVNDTVHLNDLKIRCKGKNDIRINGDKIQVNGSSIRYNKNDDITIDNGKVTIKSANYDDDDNNGIHECELKKSQINTIEILGSSNADIDANNLKSDLNINIFDSGVLKISGNKDFTKINAKIKGSGLCNFNKNNVNTFIASIKGSGEMTNAIIKNDCFLNILGSGQIHFFGNKKKINIKESIKGSGEVIIKEY